MRTSPAQWIDLPPLPQLPPISPPAAPPLPAIPPALLPPAPAPAPVPQPSPPPLPPRPNYPQHAAPRPQHPPAGAEIPATDPADHDETNPPPEHLAPEIPPTTATVGPWQLADCVPVVPATPDQQAKAIARSTRLQAVHQLATGEGIRIAIIDTGVTPHPGLATLEQGEDFLTGDDPAHAFIDCDAHGTIVAGIIGGLTTGEDGRILTTGIAPQATIRSFKQTANTLPPDTPGGTLATLAAAIHAALDDKADVINISVVSCIPAAQGAHVDVAPLHEALARAEAQGTIVVAASGNSGGNCAPGAIVFPSHLPTVLSVQALAENGEYAAYSLPAPYPSVSAPGWVPAGLSPTGEGLILGTGTIEQPQPLFGTSYAAPWVSGVAALLKSRNPQLSPAAIREHLTHIADPTTGAIDPLQALSATAEQPPTPRAITVQAPAKPPAPTPARAARLLGYCIIGLTSCLLAAAIAQRITTIRRSKQS
ncbi:S8 family serine peptidase [Corynebacterium choanae]|uniref:S8 family serine peptidase n=1 Tax=Corynebacterium choanae TaxID=1862358 RepID=UPI0013DDC887|nr:S8 family serine peptidase [Corynebacterium choanae]